MLSLCRHLIDRMLQSAYGKHGRLEGPAGVPVMTVDKPLYEVCQVLGQIQASVLPNSILKIDHAKVDAAGLCTPGIACAST